MDIFGERPRIQLPKVIVPSLCDLELAGFNVTEFGRWYLTEYRGIAGGASIGDAVELKVLDHLVANATYSAPAPYLALWTSAVTDASTAATAGELTYT